MSHQPFEQHQPTEARSLNSNSVSNFNAWTPENMRSQALSQTPGNDTAAAFLPASDKVLAGSNTSFCGIFGQTDGPTYNEVTEATGRVRRTEQPAEPGNAHLIVQLASQGRLQNADGSLTQAGQDAIASAIQNTGALQRYEGRAQDVQQYLNQNLNPPVTISFNRGSAAIPGNRLDGGGGTPAIPSTISFGGRSFSAGFGPGSQ